MVVLQWIANEALLMQTFLVTEDDNNILNANNQTVSKLIVKLRNAIESRDTGLMCKYTEVRQQ